MKICFLSLMHPPDDNRVLHREAHTLAMAGFEVTHLAPGVGSSQSKLGVRIELYPPNGRLGKYFQLYRRAVRINADCYHCNEIGSWFVGVLIKLLRRNKRVVFDVHEYYPSRFDEMRLPKWMRETGKHLLRAFFRLLTPWTDYLVFAKRSVAPDFPGTDHKQACIFNYAPLWVYDRRLEDMPASIRDEFSTHPFAIHVGGISRSRGWPQMLQALARMQNKEMHLCHMGEVFDGADALLSEASHLGVADRVHLKAQVPYEQLFDYLLCARVGLILYQPDVMNHIYAFPRKMYDYMLAGLPVIAPDFAVEVEPVVRSENCGLLVDATNVEQIGQALDWVFQNPSLALEMGRRGKEAVLRTYNWEAEAPKLLKIYTAFAESLAKPE